MTVSDLEDLVRFPAVAGIYFRHRVRTCSETHRTSKPLGTGKFYQVKSCRDVRLTTLFSLLPH